MDSAFKQLRHEGSRTKRRTKFGPPLVFDQINLLGRYAFSIPESVGRGELRLLRNQEIHWATLPVYVSRLSEFAVSIAPDYPRTLG